VEDAAERVWELAFSTFASQKPCYARPPFLAVHIIYKRYRYWLDKGYIDRLFQELCVQSVSQAEILAFLLDSMTVPVHPNACGALKKRKPVDRAFKGRAYNQNPYDCNWS